MVSFLDFFKNEPKERESLHPKERGATGTANFSGYYDEEYLQKIRDLDGIDLYDEMRRSDAQVKMLLSVVKNPILSASWGVQPVDDSDEEKEIAAFAEHVLFHDIGYKDGSKEKTFRQFMREALTMIEFGHSVFEVVHKVVMNNPKFGNYIGLSDLSWRSPKTIYEWHLARNGSLDCIRQVTQGDIAVDVKIPAKNLLVLTNELEGSNYQGISALRSIYGNHFRKTLFRKFQAVGIERASSGVPMGEIDDAIRTGGNFETQWAAFKKMLQRFAANQQNYIALEKGFKVSELKLSHDPEKVQKAIDGENIEMTKSFLANFMELGLTGGGSYSLGSDLSDIFLSSIQTVADEVAECLDRKVMRKIIRAKYGDRDFYPKTYAAGINDKAGKELAEVVKMLVEAGAIRTGERLERHLSKLYKFPDVEREQDEEDSPSEDDPNNPASGDSEDDPTAEDDQEDAELSALPDSVFFDEGTINLKPPKQAIENAKKAIRWRKQYPKETKGAGTAVGWARARQIANGGQLSPKTVKRMASFNRHRKNAAVDPEFKNTPWKDKGYLMWLAWGGTAGIDWALRKSKEIDSKLSENLTLAEKKNKKVGEFIGKNAKNLSKIMREGLTESASRFRVDVQDSLESGESRSKVLKIKMPNAKDYEADLLNFLIDLSDRALKDVANEVNPSKKFADIDDLPKKTRQRLLAQIALLASTQFEEIEKISYFFLNQNFDSEASVDDTLEELSRMHEQEIDKSKYDVAAVNAVSNAVNGVRNDFFQSPDVLDDIESFVFVNPDPKSPICQHLTGRVFSKEEYAKSPFLPPLHHNCKSTIRAQTKGDPDNLPISKEGLEVTADGEDKEKIMKSKQFTECC
jgi:hypothetical protein